MVVIVRLILILVLANLLAGCLTSSGPVRSGTAKAVTTTSELKPPDTTTDLGAYIGVAEYRIGGQDLIEIAVFQVAELNRTVRVNSAGQVSLPLIGTLVAGGKTVSELEAEIASKLEESYLQNPQVGVFVKEFSSQRITVEGAVRSPGIYPIQGRTSLIQAIVTAGGISEMANPRGIVVFRVVDGQKMAAVFDLQEIRGGDADDPEVYGDDVIVVDQSGPRTAIRRFVEAFSVFSIFRPY